jgi:hypothetical protein
VLEVLAVASIVTNVGIIGVTSTAFSSVLPLRVGGVELVTRENKVTALLFLVLFILGARALIDCLIPNEPIGLAVLRAKTKWRRHVATAVATGAEGAKRRTTEGGKMVVYGDGYVSRQHVSWDDEAIPRRFFDEDEPTAMSADEWNKLIRAGEQLDEAAAAKAKISKAALARSASKLTA